MVSRIPFSDSIFCSTSNTLNTSASGSLFKRSSQAASKKAVIQVDLPDPARAGHTSGPRSARPLSTRFVTFRQYSKSTAAPRRRHNSSM